MKITLLATADFAVPTLSKLLKEGHEVSIGTQPARPAGRGRQLRPTPIAIAAADIGLDAVELDDVNGPEGLPWLTSCQPDLLVVVAFGQKLGSAVCKTAPWGCINVHPSLLPRWRGAAPVQAALLAGDEQTGVCIIDVVERMDAGAVLGSVATTTAGKSAGDLLDELAQTGAALLVEIINTLARGDVLRISQDEDLVTRARKLSKDDGRLRWEHEAVQVDQRVRAVTPRPGAFAMLEDGKRLSILAGEPIACVRGPLPGEVIDVGREGIVVACGHNAYRITRLQRQGGKPLEADAFLRGFQLAVGVRLGP
jgi:methionyl-tRNA formyltransferase